jgi:hypothetical protein
MPEYHARETYGWIGDKDPRDLKFDTRWSLFTFTIWPLYVRRIIPLYPPFVGRLLAPEQVWIWGQVENSQLQSGFEQ